VADRQMVEIARALNSDAKLIVFDEPTAVLGGHEVDLLFAIVRRLKQRGVAIVFISHRLDEVFEIADSVTVLKDGKLVGSVPIDAVDRNKLVAMMIGRNLADIYPPKAQKVEVGEVAVEAKDVVVGDRVKGVSFDVRKGEVLGVAGMVGAGRTELAHAVFGSLPLDGGSVRLVGQAVAKPSPARSIAAGLGFLTEDRKGEGLFMLLDLAANVTAPVLDTVGESIRLDRAVEKDIARRQISDYSIATTGPEASVVNLSGGNQQKVLLSRWVISSLSSSKPKWVQTKSKLPWPLGWMCRVETLLTCCCSITLGKIVVITTVGPFHQGSGTMSRKLGSFSCMLSLKLDTCVTCSDLPASPRVEIMAACRKCSSIFSSDLLSARQSPNVTNHVCSNPG